MQSFNQYSQIKLINYELDEQKKIITLCWLEQKCENKRKKNYWKFYSEKHLSVWLKKKRKKNLINIPSLISHTTWIQFSTKKNTPDFYPNDIALSIKSEVKTGCRIYFHSETNKMNF